MYKFTTCLSDQNSLGLTGMTAMHMYSKLCIATSCRLFNMTTFACSFDLFYLCMWENPVGSLESDFIVSFPLTPLSDFLN